MPASPTPFVRFVCLRPLLAMLAAVGFAVAASGSPPALASTLTVTTTADELNSDGDCSLREAVQAANTDAAVDACTAGSGPDMISLSAGTYALSIIGREDANAAGDLDITSKVTVKGAGSDSTVIQGINQGFVPNNDRALNVLPGADVEVVDVTIAGGAVDPFPFANYFSGGGIANGGTLELIDSVVRNNTGAVGAGISSGGALTLTNSTIRNNSGGGPDGGDGAGISNAGLATLINSSVSNNVLQGFSGGSGISNYGTFVLTGSTVNGNNATGDAGAIFNAPLFAASSLSLTNSTVSGNDGGIVNLATTSSATLTMTSSTVTDAVFTEELGGTVTAFSKNSIVSGCSGTLTSQGYNLIQDTTGCTVAGVLTGNITNVDPTLDPLAYNGGPTQTRALLTGSPAIDAGSPDCPPPATDQRGIPRFGPCDIGAFEFSVLVGGVAVLPAAAVDSDTGRSGPDAGRWPLVVAALCGGLAVGATAVFVGRRRFRRG